MAILQATSTETGLVGVNPSIIYLTTDDTLAEVTTAGYLTQAVANGVVTVNLQKIGASVVSSTMALVVTTTGVTWLAVTVSGTSPNYSYNLTDPTDAGGAIFAGNVQAGSSGIAGAFLSYPATAAKGHLVLAATANTGDTLVTITNAAQAAVRTFTIPDPGVTAANFLLNNTSGTQTIATGSLALTLGNLTVAAGAIAATLGAVSAGTTVTAGTGITATTGAITATAGAVVAGTTVTAGTGITATTGNIVASAGNVTAGAAGAAGTLISFPATTGNGTLIISALNAGGAFNTTIRNSVMGQSTVYSLGDIGAATGGIPVATSVFVMKSVAGAAAAGGAAAQSFTDAFCTSGSNVIGNWNTQANAASVLKIVPGNGSFVVTSSADAGVGTFNYLITK